MELDPAVIAAAFVTVIVAFSGAAVAIINARASAAERLEAKASRVRLEETTHNVDRKADALIEKAVEIHTLTNSNLSRVTASLEIALKEIDGLRQLVESLTKAKAVADALASKEKGK